MPLFLIVNLLCCYAAQAQDAVHTLLTSPWALGAGIVLLVISGGGAVLRKLPPGLWFDGFASGAALVWFAAWHRVFLQDAPMFFAFPLYYILLTSVIVLLFVNRRERLDEESINDLRVLHETKRFHTGILAAFLLLSLVITRHYALYPIAMTLFLMRYMLTMCLEGRETQLSR